MPLTEEQEKWLGDRETDRAKKSLEVSTKLFEEAEAKADKNKKKDKDKKDKDKDKKGKDGKGDKKKKDAKAEQTAILPAIVKPKYESASQFMSIHFPNFDNEDIYPEAIGPMRTVQLIECARVMGACNEYNVPMKESTVRKALVVPQDRAEAICLENLRTADQGLMDNPIPFEYWRKFKMTGGKGKKKGGKKKKKAK